MLMCTDVLVHSAGVYFVDVHSVDVHGADVHSADVHNADVAGPRRTPDVLSVISDSSRARGCIPTITASAA